jgi:hypothetical protein
MTAVFCANAADRKADTWAEQLERFDRLEFAVSDAAKGITKAVAGIAGARRNDPEAPALEQGLDLFHTAREARRVLGRSWRRAEAAWERAEAAESRVAESRRQGIDARGVAQAARAAWDRAIGSLEQAERLESAWGRCRAAREVFRPDGHLNDRTQARAEITAAVLDLTGPDWSQVRNFLNDDRSLSFLDRMHRRLESAEPRSDWREAMGWRWWLRHHHPSSSNQRIGMVRAVGRDRVLDDPERTCSEAVAAVLDSTVRASSAVECMNSVLRMQQSRHKRMTQPMLDLKRLYWNSHVLGSGPRKDACPYQHLGLPLTSFDFWELLQADPERLTQELSGQQDAP